MPLVKIDLIKDIRTPEQTRKLADVIQQVMLDYFNAPKRDRYQARTPLSYGSFANMPEQKIITQHEPSDLICEDTNLGFTRSNALVIIQIFQQGRNTQQKQAVYKALADNLERECGLKGEDLIVSCVENTKADWSFGNGEAQFLTGPL